MDRQNIVTETRMVISEKDADTLIRALYKGKRPPHVHTLLCGCGAEANLQQDPAAWNGWRVLPTAKCPVCLDDLARQLVQWDFQPIEARARFLSLVEQVSAPKVCVQEGEER